MTTARILSTRGVNLPAHDLSVAPRKRRKDATKLTEREFMAQVVEFARMHGWRTYHTHDSRRSDAGFPDLVMVRRGTIYAWELKVKPNKANAAQLAWIDALNRAGVKAYLMFPEDWFAITKLLVEG